MYCSPSEIPFNDTEPGAIKKKKKGRMMVPDDLGEVVNAANSVSVRPKAVAMDSPEDGRSHEAGVPEVPVQAPQEDFDLMNVLENLSSGTSGSEGVLRCVNPIPAAAARQDSPRI